MDSKKTNGSTGRDAARGGAAGKGRADAAPQGWLLRVTYSRDEHAVEEMETLLPKTVRQEVTHADGDDTEGHLDFSFTREAEAIAAATRVDALKLAHLDCEIFEV